MSEVHENSLLEWLAKSGAKVSEHPMNLGAFKYHHFQSLWTSPNGQTVSSFGSDSDRRIAAIKCAAELIERFAMREYFETVKTPLAFCNSNGWAAHFNRELASQKAESEAIERHLLLKSYFSFGWSGFDLLYKIKSAEIDLYFLGSRFVADELRAGLVIAKAPSYPGVSFGYTLGNISDLGRSAFWQSAIFESADKILNLQGREFPLDVASSWLQREAHHYLTTPFDFEQIEGTSKLAITPCAAGEINVHVIELSKKMRLNFPFFAAFASGDGLIPLFSTSQLDAESEKRLASILARNKITFAPDRHPVQ